MTARPNSGISGIAQVFVIWFRLPLGCRGQRKCRMRPTYDNVRGIDPMKSRKVITLAMIEETLLSGRWVDPS